MTTTGTVTHADVIGLLNLLANVMTLVLLLPVVVTFVRSHKVLKDYLEMTRQYATLVRGASMDLHRVETKEDRPEAESWKALASSPRGPTTSSGC